MSDLIDRYLAAIARELPEAERADITAELRDELLTNIETREAELGRPVTEQELNDELTTFGNPLVVAGRYRRIQHLIGPGMFPFWLAAVKATLTVIAVVYVVLIVLGLISSGRIHDSDLPEPVLVVGFAFGVVTGVCALIERFGDPTKLALWRPERLPPAHGKTRSRFELLTEVGMGVIFLMWWVGLIHFRNVIPATDVRIELAPVWHRYFWWILGYAVIEIGSNVVALTRPDRVQLVRWMVIWRSLLGAAILLGVLQASHFVVVGGPAGKAQAIFDLWMRVGIGVAIAVFLGRAAIEAWRLRQDDRGVRVGV